LVVAPSDPTWAPHGGVTPTPIDSQAPLPQRPTPTLVPFRPRRFVGEHLPHPSPHIYPILLRWALPVCHPTSGGDEHYSVKMVKIQTRQVIVGLDTPTPGVPPPQGPPPPV